MSYELTNITISENDMLETVVKLEMYILHLEKESKNGLYTEEVKAIRDIMNDIWYKMEIDEDYILAKKL